jgi:hypothetical protein
MDGARAFWWMLGEQPSGAKALLFFGPLWHD